ncbi:hypothetical protein ACWD25_20655 [Streptomyces sp. NPDC002920]
MSRKMECPGCGSYTSRVQEAFDQEQPCPHCDLSADAAREVLTIRQSRADAELKAKYEQAIKDRDTALNEATWAKQRLATVEHQLKGLLTTLGSPLSHERRTW